MASFTVEAVKPPTAARLKAFVIASFRHLRQCINAKFGVYTKVVGNAQ